MDRDKLVDALRGLVIAIYRSTVDRGRDDFTYDGDYEGEIQQLADAICGQAVSLDGGQSDDVDEGFDRYEGLDRYEAGKLG